MGTKGINAFLKNGLNFKLGSIPHQPHKRYMYDISIVRHSLFIMLFFVRKDNVWLLYITYWLYALCRIMVCYISNTKIHRTVTFESRFNL